MKRDQIELLTWKELWINKFVNLLSFIYICWFLKFFLCPFGPSFEISWVLYSKRRICKRCNCFIICVCFVFWLNWEDISVVLVWSLHALLFTILRSSFFSDPSKQVTMFKKNYDHLPKDTYFGMYKDSVRGNPNYFLTYGNGKSVARVQDHLRPNGAHRWHNYMKTPKYNTKSIYKAFVSLIF